MWYIVLAAVIAIVHGENVKFYLNECIEDLELHNYHNYTGKVLSEPPKKVEKDSSILLFEFEYARIALFGSKLDANLNYYQAGADEKPPYFHTFFNINETGGIYLDVESHFSMGAKYCMDVQENGGKLPSVFGYYVWWKANSTFDGCKKATKTIADCTHFYDAK